MKTITAILAIALGLVALAACGQPSASAPASDAGSSAALSPSAAASPASPMTAAAAKAAATAFFDFYAARQYAATYGLPSPGARRVISERTWVTVHDRCKGGSGLAYKVSRPQLAGTTAVVNVSLAGAAASLGSEEQTFAYSHGRWLFVPSDMPVYRHRTIAQALAALTAQGICT